MSHEPSQPLLCGVTAVAQISAQLRQSGLNLHLSTVTVTGVRFVVLAFSECLNEPYVASPGSPRQTSSSSWLCPVGGARKDQGRG